MARFMSQCNFLVAPSKFVYNEITNAGYTGDVYWISHGVDTNIFKPLPEDIKQEMRERLKIEDKEFILYTCMRNKSPFQKDYPALFHAWKTMIENHPELQKKGILLCLTDPLEPTGMRLDLLRNRAGLQNFIRFIWARPSKDLSTLEATYEGDPNGFMHNANYNLSHSEMAKIYNVADAYVQASFGESFALPVLESMACAIPQINVAHSTGPEHVGESKAGLLANVKAELTTPLISDSWLVDPKSLAECIERMYLDKELRKRCSKNALDHAKKFDWSIITKRWCDLFGAIEYLS